MSQNLQNFVKFQKFQLDNLVDFEKCCKTHIFLQKSVPIQPKTSNILPKFCQKLATACMPGRGTADAHALDDHRPDLDGRTVVWGRRIDQVAKCFIFITGSFSAVSKRIFASKYAFDSIFQALQDLHPFAPLQSQNFRKKSV